MLRITIELIPGGNESRKRSIGVMHIINNATSNSHEFGNYDIIEMDADDYDCRKWKAMKVERVKVFKFLACLFKQRTLK